MPETNPALYYDDEISISELLMKLWAKRGLIVMLPLVLAGLTIVGLLMSKSFQQPPTIEYFIELNGIRLEAQVAGRTTSTDKGTGNTSDTASRDSLATLYPNGAAFSPQDLVNPLVLKIIGADFDLDTQSLAKSIDVQFGTPISSGVLAEYRSALSANSNSSAADLANLNRHYEEKVNAAAKRGLKISIDFRELNVTEKVGQYIAESLAKAWNQVYIEQFNTSIPRKISRLQLTDGTTITNTAVGLQQADIKLREVEKGVAVMAESSFRGLRTDSGLSASDLLGSIGDFRRIFFEPVFSAAFEKQSSLSRLYEQGYRVQLETLAMEMTEIDARVSDIRNYQNRTLASNTQNSGNQSAQLDGSALTAIVKLSEQATLSVYLQESLNQRYELVKYKSDLMARLARIQPRNEDAAIELSNEFLQQTFDRYAIIIGGYRELLLTMQASQKDQIPSYYSVITQPESDRLTELLNKRDLLYITLALALGGMLAIITALVWPQRPQSQAS